jgi:cobalt-zinc-cadmium efflux system outer membrane protein
VLATYDADVLAKIATIKQMAEDSFRTGDSELIDLLDATRTRFEVKLTRIDLLEAAVEAEVDVLSVTGRIEEVRP